MTLVYESEHAAVHRGDALRVLPALPPCSVDAIITDPPYSSGGQYRGDRTADPRTKYFPADSPTRRLETFTGDNRDQRGFLRWSTMWLDEALRVAQPGAVLAAFCDWRQLPIMTDAIQAGGWTWRGIVVWCKPNARPRRARFSAACEYLVWATAGGRPVDYPADTLHGFVEADPPRDRVHPTQKPLEVLRHLVRIAPPDGLVLDPF
ncbi:MAG TPA: DNA methyltransferase, partial [Pseudonocardiaceae bacterium]|nr:DNA methyltransferase [Pseudonocardiaceae bacterium]